MGGPKKNSQNQSTTPSGGSEPIVRSFAPDLASFDAALAAEKLQALGPVLDREIKKLDAAQSVSQETMRLEFRIED